ncbi:GIY-YIG nuclease family protein [Actinacidiphila sp. DG2A-62]|uniref:GIY-YIG nuclease family protein n=1 Tax=Actinacidiphila sp. DG2A-62 TaxID=3108821 RepID=UPI002DB87F5B|nr:GIY-YIG nuclease family protein [Actinacidiphila sp. DG2A-62]MEC3995233.1 GIY-YIG nuclease family protein [Actinacidiphila sp. DG2A-62]
MPPLEDQPTAVYRLYGADGTLLYIGLTNSPETRWKYHALTKEWWPLVARKTVDWRPNRLDAERTEAAAIQAEGPRHNCIHSPVGPDDMPLRDARSALGPPVDSVRNHGEHRWITRHGRRAAVVVPLGFYEQALADRAARGETPAG